MPYLFIVGLFMTSRPLPADLCRGRRRSSSRSQSRLRLPGVRCVLKLLMRKLLSRAGNCELNRIGNWPLEVQQQQGSFSATIPTESTGNHLIRSPLPQLSFNGSTHSTNIPSQFARKYEERQLSHSTDRKCFGSCSFALRTRCPFPLLLPLSLCSRLFVFGQLCRNL